MEPTDIFPVVHMPPNKSTPLVLVTPERLAELEAEIGRLRGALKHIVSMAAQDMMLDDYGLHTNQVVLTGRAALEPKGDGDE